jgi:fucose permease
MPGVLVALLALLIREPRRGATETDAEAVPPPSLRATYVMLWRNQTYVFASIGFIAYTFALGGLAAWFPSLLQRYDGWSLAGANQVLGGITVAAGFLGTFAGGFLGDYLLRYTRNSYLWISGLCMFFGAPITVLALAGRTAAIYLPAIFAAEFFLFLNTGPLNAVILNCVPARIRATAMAANIFFIHALGDVISPPIIGALSDRYGLFPATMITPLMMVISGCFLLYAIRFDLPEPQKKAG